MVGTWQGYNLNFAIFMGHKKLVQGIKKLYIIPKKVKSHLGKIRVVNFYYFP